MGDIGLDKSRFKEIVKNKIRDNLKGFVSNEYLIGKSGDKLVKIPITSIDIPRFRFGSKDKGGMGAGDGDNGDPIFGDGNKPGKGDPGDNASDHEFTADFTPDELVNIIKEELQLPELEPKGNGDIASEKSRYNKISSIGNESLRHAKRTFKEALKREIATGAYNPNDPKIIPVKGDKRYRSPSTQETPEINGVAFFIMDVSGSMSDNIKQIAKTHVYWIDMLLRSTYPKLDTVFIIHDTEAKEVNREDFFKVSTSGGTHISSAYEMCSRMMENIYPSNCWNSFIFQFSDSDNARPDNEPALKLLRDNIIPNCNRFCFGEICNAGGGLFTDYLEANFEGQIRISRVDSAEDTIKSIKRFFE